MAGPLNGTRIIELAGIGPVPFAGMLLADLGADVIRVDRPGASTGPDASAHRVLARGRRSLALDLKHPDAPEVVLRLAERSDALLEGMRPGVAERLGIGPATCLARNPRLVYGRMTGYGQTGPLAGEAGHDINYIALAGALALIGRPGQPPTVPLNLLGDFAGGGLMLAFGVLAGILHARGTGHGDVVDAAMVDGVASLLAMPLALRAAGAWRGGPGENLLDGGAPFYDVYRCADGKYVAVGALEDRFYAALLTGLDLSDDPVLPSRDDPAAWPALRAMFAARFAARDRDEWAARFAGSDACVSPVLTPDEAAQHPHLAARGTLREGAGGGLEPAPTPRFDRNAAGSSGTAPAPGTHTVEVLTECGYSPAEIDELSAVGAIRRPATA